MNDHTVTDNDPVHVIFNPSAGGGKAGKIYTLLNLVLCKRLGKHYSFHVTRKRNDATLFCRQAISNGARLIIAAGGDGTINEIINGFYNHDRPINPSCELGIIDCGTGQGFARSLGLPGSLDDQLEIIFNGSGRMIDTGLIRYTDYEGNKHKRYFISECQVGIGGNVALKVGFRLKKLGGKLAFGLTALKEAICSPSVSMTIKCNGHDAFTRKLIGIVIGNGNFCGGGMQLTPDAKLNDRLFNVLFINEMNRIERILNFMKIYKGDHIRTPAFTYLTTDSVMIDAPAKSLLEADGEILGTTPCIISIIPDQLRVRTTLIEQI